MKQQFDIYEQVINMMTKTKPARLKRIKTALSGRGLYGKLSTPTSAAWLIYSAMAAPTSNQKRLVEWIEKQYHFFSAMEQEGQQTTVSVLEYLFSNPDQAREVVSILIEVESGAVMIQTRKKGIQAAVKYTASAELPKMPICLIIPGEVVQRFADYFSGRRAALN
jgi:hypothetical protein